MIEMCRGARHFAPRIFQIATILLLLACGGVHAAEQTTEELESMKVPYQEEATVCYDRLQQTRLVFREGFKEIRTKARSRAPFNERLSRIVTTHMNTIAESRKQQGNTTWSEEDTFLCCVYDLLQALFADEAAKISKSEAPPEEKEQRLKELVDLLNGIPFTGPPWNQAVRPGIKKQLDAELQKVLPCP